MSQTTKTVEQLLTFLAQKLSPSVHQVYAVYYRMAVIGAWERIIVGGLFLVIGSGVSGILLHYLFKYKGSITSNLLDGYICGWIVGGGLAVIGFFVGLIGMAHLLDPAYQVIRLLLLQAGGHA